METIHQQSPNSATTILVEMLKPFLKQTIADALAELSDKVKPRPPRPFTVEETSEYLSIPISSLYQLTSKKKIPFFKRGKKLYFYQDQLDAWIKEERR
jgi:excisionase family DNA binding protein